MTTKVFLFTLFVIVILVAFLPDQPDNSPRNLDGMDDSEQQIHSNYPIPDDYHLNISGTLSNKPYDLDITYEVQYAGRNNKSSCKKYNFFYGKQGDIKWHQYKANVTNDHHSIILPLNEYPAYKGCQFQPSLVYVGISRAGKDPNQGIDQLFGNQEHISQYNTIGYRYYPVKENQLTVECRQEVYGGGFFDNNWNCHQKSESKELMPLLQELKPTSLNRDWIIDFDFAPIEK